KVCIPPQVYSTKAGQIPHHVCMLCSSGSVCCLSDCSGIFNEILKLHGRLSCDTNDLSEHGCRDGGPMGNICQQLSDSGLAAEPRSSNRHVGWMPEETSLRDMAHFSWNGLLISTSHLSPANC
ncbi:mCG144945, isoform CRA_a, partial [Mus musculus]